MSHIKQLSKSQKEEVSEVKYATYDEINELFENNMFIKDRWEFVKDKIKEYIEKMLNISGKLIKKVLKL